MKPVVLVDDELTPAQKRLSEIVALPENEKYRFEVPIGEGSDAVAQIRSALSRVRADIRAAGRKPRAFKLFKRIIHDTTRGVDIVELWKSQSSGTTMKNALASTIDSLAFPASPDESEGC